MKVSLDGGITYHDAPQGVRVAYQVDVPGEDYPTGELMVNLSDEGLILDVWASREEPGDYNIGTSSETLVEIVERLVESNA